MRTLVSADFATASLPSSRVVEGVEEGRGRCYTAKPVSGGSTCQEETCNQSRKTATLSSAPYATFRLSKSAEVMVTKAMVIMSALTVFHRRQLPTGDRPGSSVVSIVAIRVVRWRVEPMKMFSLVLSVSEGGSVCAKIQGVTSCRVTNTVKIGAPTPFGFRKHAWQLLWPGMRTSRTVSAKIAT